MSPPAVHYRCAIHRIGSQRLQTPVPRSLGVQVPPADPEAWRHDVHRTIAARAAAEYAGHCHRDDWLRQGPPPYGDGDTAEVLSCISYGTTQKPIGVALAKEVYLARKGVLERERCVVARLLRQQRWRR